MTRRGYEWLVLAQCSVTWVHVLGVDAFTPEWLLVTLAFLACWVLGLVLGWLTDERELPMVLVRTVLDVNALNNELDALRLAMFTSQAGAHRYSA